MVVLSLAGGAAATSEFADVPASQRVERPRITIAVLPQHVAPSDLAGVDDTAIGLLSAGIGRVPPAQTYIDIGQGARLFPSLYDRDPPLLYTRPAQLRGAVRIEPRLWRIVRRRAEDAPADLVPGLLGSTLARAGAAVHADPFAGSAAAIVADRRGVVPGDEDCPGGECPGVSVMEAGVGQLPALVRRLRAADLLIAFERPPPRHDRQLAVAVAGRGFHGTLTSDSTRMDGFVLSTDIAATILDRLGVAVPDEMTGEPIRSEGEADPAGLVDLQDRLAEVGPRRGPVIGTSLLVWVGLAALAGIVAGNRGLRAALPLLAVTVAYLPAMLLVTAALEPGELAERLIAGLGSPILALGTLRLLPGYAALALAGAVSLAGYAIDVIAGSSLTEVSLIGPNPALGVRFYGIGNELEAVVAALVPIATGAALVAWAPRASPRAAATTFAVTALVAVAAFAPGSFGADVGAAIDIPIGAGVAAFVCLGGGRIRVVLLLAAPLAALAALVAVDLLLGGDAHLTRSVLQAGGLDQVGEVAERRLRLSAESFSRYADWPVFWIAVALILAAVVKRRTIQAWFAGRSAAWAGFVGAAAATAAGTLANDSGALLLMIGTLFVALFAAFAWATRANPGVRARA